MDPKDLEKAIRRLLIENWPEDQLRTKLETLAEKEENFSAFTWLWAPVLYRRNRVLFRPFILARFGRILRVGKFRWKNVEWKGDAAAALDPWLAEADRFDDIELFRRLYEWKLSALGTRLFRDQRQKTILTELRKRFKAARTRAERQIVLQKFTLWLELDEPTALELYRADPLTAARYILRHLPFAWMENKRPFWEAMLKEADGRQDEDFRWKLYRAQVPRERWKSDVLALATRVRDPADLVRQLERHHPGGWGRSEGGVFEALLRQRGRDVMPYIVRNLRSVRHGMFHGGEFKKLLGFAREKGWWDLWAAIIRVCATQKEFNEGISNLLRDAVQQPNDVARRLAALAGVSREMNFPGIGFAIIHQLNEETALGLLRYYPDLLRGPYLQHLQVGAWTGSFSALIDVLIEKDEDDLLDHVAARIVTRTANRWGVNRNETLREAEQLATHFDAIKDRDELLFSRRATSVLSRIPAYSIQSYHALLRDNRLARLLFARSAPAYLADGRSLRDLVEAAEIHVMALAYRALSLDDPRAPSLAAENLSLLLGTLLRPLHRGTRVLAFGALANAATTEVDAGRILAKAREALDLPDDKYPKEALIGLIAKLLARWPALRGPLEAPVVYRSRAA